MVFSTIVIILMLLIFLVHLTAIFRVRENHKDYLAMTLKKGAYPLPASAPLVSVLVPARNEERDIGKCLQSLIRQDYPNMEIIAIDDQSTDGTQEIIGTFRKKDKRVNLINGDDLPPGWMGKNYALYRGFQHAKGEYLLFIDADVVLAPECISRTVGYALEHKTDLFALNARHELSGFWEKVVMPVTVTIMWILLSFRLLNEPRSKAVMGAGWYLLFNRKTYEKIGGHQRVKDSNVEDILFAGIIKEEGYNFRYLFGRDLLSIHQYSGLRELWKGFSRSYYKGVGESLFVALFSLFLLSFFLILPWLSVPLALVYLLVYHGGWFPVLLLLLGLGQCFLALFVRNLLKIYIGLNNSYAFLQFLGVLIIAGIITYSTARAIMGKGITWKGRTLFKRREGRNIYIVNK